MVLLLRFQTNQLSHQSKKENYQLTARETKVFNSLNHSLISLGQLYDNDCKSVLTKTKLYAYKDNKKVLEGNCSTSGDGLWNIPKKLILSKN